MIYSSHVIIFIGGKMGTLNEFTIAFHEKKNIGVLKGAGGVSSLLPKIVSVCDKIGEKDNVIFFSDVKDFLRKL
mgnify:CR=1 FL=1